MLVLTRAKGQKIMISNDIVLTVIEVNGDQVKIGIEAPAEISVYREEIYMSIKKQNELALKSDLSSDQLEVLKSLMRSKNN